MSLDSYLSKKIYIGNDRDKLKITGIKSRIDITKVVYIVEDIAYWRKANAIHSWFVNNVQKSEDDCKPYPVSAEQLKKLFDLCKQVQKEPGKAPDLLPTQSGFLFGSTDYDNRYFQNIGYTIDVLWAEFKEHEDQSQEYEYQSSW